MNKRNVIAYFFLLFFISFFHSNTYAQEIKKCNLESIIIVCEPVRVNANVINYSKLATEIAKKLNKNHIKTKVFTHDNEKEYFVKGNDEKAKIFIRFGYGENIRQDKNTILGRIINIKQNNSVSASKLDKIEAELNFKKYYMRSFLLADKIFERIHSYDRNIKTYFDVPKEKKAFQINLSFVINVSPNKTGIISSAIADGIIGLEKEMTENGDGSSKFTKEEFDFEMPSK